MQDIYDEYVDYYNSSDKKNERISILAEFITIQERAEKLAGETMEALNSLLDDLKVDMERNIAESKLSRNNHKKLRNLKDRVIFQVNLNLRNPYYFLSLGNKFENIKRPLEEFYEKASSDSFGILRSLRADSYLESFKENLKRNRQSNAHSEALSYIVKRIIKENYPLELPIYNNLQENEKEELPNGSNAGKLHVASDWLFDLVKAISSFEQPTHEKILQRIQNDFPEFEQVPGEVELSFTKGHNNINKTSIDKALTYLFNKKHEENISTGTIKRRFDDYDIW